MSSKRMCSDELVEIQGEPEEIVCSIDLNIKEELNEYESEKEHTENFNGDHFLSQSTTKQEHPTDSSANFTCRLCDCEFNDEYDFLSHKRKHRKEKLCTICNKIYTHNSHLRIHATVKPYRCSVCQQGFTMKQNLQRHQLRRHSALRPHVCNDCGKAFPLRDQLKCHARVHTGERPYSCNLCQRTFSDRSYYGRHMKQHAAVATEPGGEPQRLFSCRLCPKSFNSYSNLYGHIRTHTPAKRYICNECGRGFHRNAHLKSHARTHTKPPKAIGCTECERRFCSNRSLRKHMASKHNDVSNIPTTENKNLFNCEQCHQCFVTRTNFDEHMNTHER